MFKYVIVYSMMFISISCSNNNRDINLQKTLKADTSSASTANMIRFDDPEIIDSSGVIVYPLILNTSYYSSYGSSDGKERRESYWNYLFYDTKTGRQHILTHDKILIFNSYIENQYNSDDESGVSVFNNCILYLGASKDYNSDSILDSNDPVYLFASDRQGNNFRQVSPDDYSITSWKAIKGTTKIILEGQKDDHADKKFNEFDKRIQLIVDISQNNVASETFSQIYIDSLKQAMIKTWR